MVTLKEVVSTRQRQIRPSLLHVATSSLEMTTKSIETQEKKNEILSLDSLSNNYYTKR